MCAVLGELEGPMKESDETYKIFECMKNGLLSAEQQKVSRLQKLSAT